MKLALGLFWVLDKLANIKADAHKGLQELPAVITISGSFSEQGS